MLMNDIIRDLKNDYHKDLIYDKERYSCIIDELTTTYFKDNEILFVEPKEILSDEKCLARTWNDGYGNHQCTRKVFDCKKKLCKTHHDLSITDNLWLGLITDPRPEKPYHNGHIKLWKD
jgi:hypothetical protein